MLPLIKLWVIFILTLQDMGLLQRTTGTLLVMLAWRITSDTTITKAFNLHLFLCDHLGVNESISYRGNDLFKSPNQFCN